MSDESRVPPGRPPSGEPPPASQHAFLPGQGASAPGGGPPGRPPLDPIGVLLSRTVALYKNNWRVLIVTAGIVLLPLFLLRNVLTTSFLTPGGATTVRLEERSHRLSDLAERIQAVDPVQDAEQFSELQKQLVSESFDQVAEGAGTLGGVFSALILSLITIPLTLLSTFLAQGALTVMVNDRASGGTLPPKEAWNRLGSRLSALLITSLLVTAGVFIGTVLCVLPGLIFAFACAFVMPIVVLENQSGTSAIERSIRMVQVDFVRVLVAFLIMLMIQLVVGFVGASVPLGLFGSTLVADLLTIAILPLPITALVLMHRELLAKGIVPPAPAP